MSFSAPSSERLRGKAYVWVLCHQLNVKKGVLLMYKKSFYYGSKKFIPSFFP